MTQRRVWEKCPKFGGHYDAGTYNNDDPSRVLEGAFIINTETPGPLKVPLLDPNLLGWGVSWPCKGVIILIAAR